MRAFLWALLGSAGVTVAEVIMRRTPDAYPWPVAAFSILMSYCLWQIFRQENLIAGTVIVSLTMALLRTFAALWIGDQVTPGAWTGLALIILASFVRNL